MRGQVKAKLSKLRWIEMYGGEELLERDGFDVVPCVNCDDPICHGWRVVKTKKR